MTGTQNGTQTANSSEEAAAWAAIDTADRMGFLVAHPLAAADSSDTPGAGGTCGVDAHSTALRSQ
ncbi:hypothetical protein [Mycolicibacterium aubagnense]|uniref:hypothetical protein n=1 Tax=Mycolicibacterium aubagnense TaxID=319707 RepID=UPI0010FD80ED|nr:hypothetical protein [Mycolicibacterium aubagnense]WGI30469.1 hypothetical protein QDT91_14215 [Mycolicibacterium aubagnense]